MNYIFFPFQFQLQQSTLHFTKPWDSIPPHHEALRVETVCRSSLGCSCRWIRLALYHSDLAVVEVETPRSGHVQVLCWLETQEMKVIIDSLSQWKVCALISCLCPPGLSSGVGQHHGLWLQGPAEDWRGLPLHVAIDPRCLSLISLFCPFVTCHLGRKKKKTALASNWIPNY